MRKSILAIVAAFPLFFSVSQAEQNVSSDWPRAYGYSSEDSGPGSYLGVDIADITSDRLGVLKLKEERGAEVTMVDQDAPAGKAGIKEHDVILSVNGTPVEGRAQLQRMIHETPAGRVITLGLSRDGQPMTIKVQLGDRSTALHMYKDYGKEYHVEVPPIPPIPPIPSIDLDVPNIGIVYVHSSMRSGLMVENITQQLGEFFGTKNGGGVLVRSVDKGSRGEQAGLRAGDVIVRVGDQPIRDTSDFTHALHSRNGASISLVVVRDKKEQNLTLTLPERKESGDMIQESFDSNEEAEQDRFDFSELQDELAELRPEFELATNEANDKALDEVRSAMRAQEKTMRQQVEKLQKEYSPKVREELETSRDKVQRQMEQLRRELRSNGFDL